MSSNLTSTLQQLLQNATNPEIVKSLAAQDVTYVSLNFSNPDLNKIMPWAGTHTGPMSVVEGMTGVGTFWNVQDFQVTDTIEQGDRVAFFGSFTYKTNVTGKVVTSPFSLLARFAEGKVIYVQFLEDSFATANSFKTGGTTRYHSDPAGPEIEV